MFNRDASQDYSYKREKFSTRLPAGRRYTAAHYWLAPDTDEKNLWYIGFTKFATRMLGDIVEFDFEINPGDQIQTGQVIGWIEGFKATSDIYAVIDGEYLGINPALDEDPECLGTRPYYQGWLYKVKGEPDPNSLDLDGYCRHLDATIDKMLEGT